MAYVIIQGDAGGPEKSEALVKVVGKAVGEIFSLPLQEIVAVAHGNGGAPSKVLAGGEVHDVRLEITIEGAGVGEEDIRGIVKRVARVASEASGCNPGEVMVLVKIPGGPHMKNTSRCYGIGG